MKNFNDMLKTYKEIIKKYNKGDEKFKRSSAELSIEEVKLFCEALTYIYENVKLPGNKELVLQTVMNHESNAVELTDSFSVLRLLKMATILAGVIEDAKKDVLKFVMEGDSGHASLELNMIQRVVEREKEGIDYQEENTLIQ